MADEEDLDALLADVEAMEEKHAQEAKADMEEEEEGDQDGASGSASKSTSSDSAPTSDGEYDDDEFELEAGSGSDATSSAPTSDEEDEAPQAEQNEDDANHGNEAAGEGEERGGGEGTEEEGDRGEWDVKEEGKEPVGERELERKNSVLLRRASQNDFPFNPDRKDSFKEAHEESHGAGDEHTHNEGGDTQEPVVHASSFDEGAQGSSLELGQLLSSFDGDVKGTSYDGDAKATSDEEVKGMPNDGGGKGTSFDGDVRGASFDGDIKPTASTASIASVRSKKTKAKGKGKKISAEAAEILNYQAQAAGALDAYYCQLQEPDLIKDIDSDWNVTGTKQRTIYEYAVSELSRSILEDVVEEAVIQAQQHQKELRRGQTTNVLDMHFATLRDCELRVQQETEEKMKSVVARLQWEHKRTEEIRERGRVLVQRHYEEETQGVPESIDRVKQKRLEERMLKVRQEEEAVNQKKRRQGEREHADAAQKEMLATFLSEKSQEYLSKQMTAETEEQQRIKARTRQIKSGERAMAVFAADLAHSRAQTAKKRKQELKVALQDHGYMAVKLEKGRKRIEALRLSKTLDREKEYVRTRGQVLEIENAGSPHGFRRTSIPARARTTSPPSSGSNKEHVYSNSVRKSVSTYFCMSPKGSSSSSRGQSRSGIELYDAEARFGKAYDNMCASRNRDQGITPADLVKVVCSSGMKCSVQMAKTACKELSVRDVTKLGRDEFVEAGLRLVSRTCEVKELLLAAASKSRNGSRAVTARSNVPVPVYQGREGLDVLEVSGSPMSVGVAADDEDKHIDIAVEGWHFPRDALRVHVDKAGTSKLAKLAEIEALKDIAEQIKKQRERPSTNVPFDASSKEKRSARADVRKKHTHAQTTKHHQVSHRVSLVNPPPLPPPDDRKSPDVRKSDEAVNAGVADSSGNKDSSTLQPIYAPTQHKRTSPFAARPRAPASSSPAPDTHAGVGGHTKLPELAHAHAQESTTGEDLVVPLLAPSDMRQQRAGSSSRPGSRGWDAAFAFRQPSAASSGGDGSEGSRPHSRPSSRQTPFHGDGLETELVPIGQRSDRDVLAGLRTVEMSDKKMEDVQEGRRGGGDEQYVGRVERDASQEAEFMPEEKKDNTRKLGRKRPF